MMKLASLSSLLMVVVLLGLGGDARHAKLEDDPCAPDCTGGEEGYYPHPQDCTLYYQCSQGTPILQHCSEGLHYNPTTHTCDFPDHAGCTADPNFDCGGDPTTTLPPTYPTTTTTETPTTTEGCNTSPSTTTPTEGTTTSEGTVATTPITTNPTTTPTPTYSTTTTTEEFTTTTQSPVSTTDPSECVPPCPYEDALYPNPRNCSSFFHCFGFTPFLEYCPPNQEYCLELERCDWPEVANCEASDDTPCVALTNPPEEGTTTVKQETSTTSTNTVPTPDDTTPASSTTQSPVSTTDPSECVPMCPYEDAFYPNPRNCSTYFHCSGFTPVLQDCPPGHEYSLELVRCDWPEVAQCEASDDTPCVALTNAPTDPTTIPSSTTEEFTTTVIQETSTTSTITVTTPDDTTPDSSTTQSPVSTTDPSECVPPCPYVDALYPNPRNCSNFFHCSGFTPVLQDCPPNQEYCLELVRCDWPEVAKCEASDDTPCVAMTNPPEY